MALDPATLLDLVEAVIVKRLRADAYESYTEPELTFQGTSLDRLYEMRTQLQQEISASQGGNFRLAEPFDG